jgi:phosphoserine phosphatase
MRTLVNMAKIKFVFFDMEGTLYKKAIKFAKGNTAPSAWTLIAKHLGEKALEEEDATKDKWNDNKYAGYVEWMEDTISIHKKYGLNKEFFEKVMDSIEFHDGVKEVFDELNKRGVRTALISGGFKAGADRAQKELKIDHAFSACEYFWDSKGELLHWNLLPCDYEGKVDFMKLIMKEHGLSPDECAFVGDGKNDVFLAKEVGTSVSFNGAEELMRVSTHSVNQPEGKEDFKEVLKFL